MRTFLRLMRSSLEKGRVPGEIVPGEDAQFPDGLRRLCTRRRRGVKNRSSRSGETSAAMPSG